VVREMTRNVWMTSRGAGDSLSAMKHAFVFAMMAAASAAGCDISMPIHDGGPDVVHGTDAALDAPMGDGSSSDATSSDAPNPDAYLPYDGASGIGNGTCAETGSFCNSNAQCCSGYCNPTTMWSGGGMCDVNPPDGGAVSWDAGTPPDGATCSAMCHCNTNQHCCLMQSSADPCGYFEVCSVVVGCQ
jgi:hypothetical protein